MKIPITGPAYDVDVPSYQSQRCINWFPESDQASSIAPARFPAMLRPTPGITQLNDFGDFNYGRGSIVFRDIGYVVLDNCFMYIASDGTPNYIDFINSSTGPISMVGGLDGILMADGTNAYFYNVTTLTFSVVDTSGLQDNPIWASYISGYHILLFLNSERVYMSPDPTTWDPLMFASANSQADYLQGAIAERDQLWLMGTDNTEVWAAQGNPDSPIQKLAGVVITKGTRAPNTIVAMQSSVIWLATDKNGGYVVVKMNGYIPETISTVAITKQISNYTTVSDAYAFSHRVGEHEFYVLTFPTENKTWVYDTLEQIWHERVSIISVDPTLEDYEPLLKAHRAKNHFYTSGIHFVLDQYTGSISKYDEDVFTEYDLPILRQRRTSPLSADNLALTGTIKVLDHDNKLHSYYNLVLEMEPGVGTSSGQGSDPVVMLSVSRDGGHTWEEQDDASIGAQGVFDNPIRWDMLGQARNLVLDFKITDPVNAIILGATIDSEKNTN